VRWTHSNGCNLIVAPQLSPLASKNVIFSQGRLVLRTHWTRGHKVSKSLGPTFEIVGAEGWGESSYILWIHNSGVNLWPYFIYFVLLGTCELIPLLYVIKKVYCSCNEAFRASFKDLVSWLNWICGPLLQTTNGIQESSNMECNMPPQNPL
jgi:hypothetical protein